MRHDQQYWEEYQKTADLSQYNSQMIYSDCKIMTELL